MLKHSLPYRCFSIELEKKEYISELVLSNDKKNNVLITGELGKITNVELLEQLVLEIRFTNGNICLDIDVDELFEFISKITRDPELEKK